MNLNYAEWKEYRLGDLITEIYKAKAINRDDLTESKDSTYSIRYITRTAENNGCELLADIREIDSKNIEKANAISIGDTTATCFYQDEAFITGDHMVVIRADEWLNPYTALYILTILNNEQYKYSYGRAFLMERIKETLVKLPQGNDGKPDWKKMENYIKSLRHKPLTTKNKSGEAPDLNVNSWGEFTLNDIFQLKGGFYNKKPEHSTEGNIPFLASTENNNGVTELYSIEDIKQWDKVGNEDWTLDKKIYPGNCIAVTVNGSVCNAFYQSEDFTCSHDITALYLRHHELNPYIAFFLCTIIMQDKYRWSYGRKPHDVKKFGKSFIKLPITKEGLPDWLFMEKYIKNLPYGDRI